MRPTLPTLNSVNHRLPSGPTVIPLGILLAVGTGNSVMLPPVVMRPISPTDSVNQRLPSGPAVMPTGSLPAVGTGNAVKAPPVVTRPMAFALNVVNQRLPSGPV